MASALPGVVAEIDALDTLGDRGRLDGLVTRFFALSEAAVHLDVWFRLFERFPIDDGADNKLFWSVMHGIERQPGYEELVVASVRRAPADFPLLMVNRMLNGGSTVVGGTDLVALLESAARDVRRPAEVRENAQRYADRHRGRRTNKE